MHNLHADISIGSVFGDTISNEVVKFYSFPFPGNGLTLNWSLSSRYIDCYASDRYRNPNQYMYDWFVEVRDYWETFFDPRDLSRTAGSFLYVSFLGVDTTNTYQAESFIGNTLTVGESVNQLAAHNCVDTHKCYTLFINGCTSF